MRPYLHFSYGKQSLEAGYFYSLPSFFKTPLKKRFDMARPADGGMVPAVSTAGFVISRSNRSHQNLLHHTIQRPSNMVPGQKRNWRFS